MNFLVVLACTIAFSWLVRKPLKKYPVLFYLLAVALSIVYLVTALWSVPPVVRNVIFVLMQKCTLALAFFTVVMFVGVFDKDSAIGQGLRPVRAELSIVACILTIGHMVVCLIPFAPCVFGGHADTWVMVFFVTAIALLCGSLPFHVVERVPHGHLTGRIACEGRSNAPSGTLRTRRVILRNRKRPAWQITLKASAR